MSGRLRLSSMLVVLLAALFALAPAESGAGPSDGVPKPANGRCWTDDEARSVLMTKTVLSMLDSMSDAASRSRGETPQCHAPNYFIARFPACSGTGRLVAIYREVQPVRGCAVPYDLEVLLSTVKGKAAFDMALKYDRGGTLPLDYRMARAWYLKAGDDYPYALGNLGYLEERGLGGAQDYQSARKHYEAAANKGDSYSMRNLGGMYERGEGMSPDNAMAASWYRKAMMAGDTEATADLGTMYYYGRGVRQDRAEGLRLFRLAASKNDAWAMRQLCYIFGWESENGSPSQRQPALGWCRKALARAKQLGDSEVANDASKAIDELEGGGSSYAGNNLGGPSNAQRQDFINGSRIINQSLGNPQ